jgi:serine/threonine protein kinase
MTGPFDEKLARTYFHKFISGLNACHAANVVHRDMKPENLLLNDTFDIKLADFGLAAAISVDGAMRTTRCGTESYMSPELLSLHQGQKYDGKPVDIFACGCILFIMLVGGMALFDTFCATYLCILLHMTCVCHCIKTLLAISHPLPTRAAFLN